MKALLSNYYYDADWETYLTQKERRHTISIKLHRCSKTSVRGSIQILLPDNLTLKDYSGKCLENSDFDNFFQYLSGTHSFSIDLSTMLGSTDSPETLAFRITFREIGEVRKIGGKHIYLMRHRFQPHPNSFTCMLNLPAYRNRYLRWLVNVIAHAMKKQGAYDIVDIDRSGEIDAKNGIITFRFAGTNKFGGSALGVGILYSKAWKMSLGSLIFGLIFGFTVGLLSSMLANWISG